MATRHARPASTCDARLGSVLADPTRPAPSLARSRDRPNRLCREQGTPLACVLRLVRPMGRCVLRPAQAHRLRLPAALRPLGVAPMTEPDTAAHIHFEDDPDARTELCA